jgi:uncharacterized membrane protein YpjA
MNKYLKISLFGFLIWLIPFVVGFLFYSPEGEIRIDPLVFKAIMTVVATITEVVLLVSYFRKIDKNYLPESIMVGLIWFALNIVLDLLILIPMSKMAIGTYFTQIGMQYLTIPTISIAIGLVTKIATEKVKE